MTGMVSDWPGSILSLQWYVGRDVQVIMDPDHDPCGVQEGIGRRDEIKLRQV